jgi:hypothetical protein
VEFTITTGVFRGFGNLDRENFVEVEGDKKFGEKCPVIGVWIVMLDPGR